MGAQAAIVGLGFVGKAHAEALRRLGIRIRGVLERTADFTERAARDIGADISYGDLETLVADGEVDVVHICTPNHLHFGIARDVLTCGKHVICEKPLAMNSQETLALVQMTKRMSLVGAVSYNLRYYPLCQQACAIIQAGEIGEPKLIHGSYLQDWLFYPTDWNWRLEPESGGSQRAVSDIGTHWLDLAQWMTGLKVTEVCADAETVIPVRKKPRIEQATFDGKLGVSDEVEDVEIHTEDYASILLRFDQGAKGVLMVSQVSAGRKNRLWLEVDGTKGSLMWNSEDPNHLWIGKRDGANAVLIKDPALMASSVRSFAAYPGGHAEGYPDTFVQFFKDVYGYIANNDLAALQTYPNFETGHEEVLLSEAIALSAKNESWVKVPTDRDS